MSEFNEYDKDIHREIRDMKTLQEWEAKRNENIIRMTTPPSGGVVGGISCQKIPEENIYRPNRAPICDEDIKGSIEFSKSVINAIDPNNPMDEFNKQVQQTIERSGSIAPMTTINDSFHQSLIDKCMNKAIKHDSDKPRYDLLPYDAIEKIVEVLTIGAKTYSDRNWEQGLKYSRCFAALQRHLVAWFQMREDNDKETNTHHLANAACELLFLLSYEIRSTDINLDDRPVVNKVK